MGRFLNRMPWQGNNKLQLDYILSNYSLIVMDMDTKGPHIHAIEEGRHSYIQDRYNLYEFADSNPSNGTEPYSTIRNEVEGSGGGRGVPARNGATLENTIKEIRRMIAEPMPNPRDFATREELDEAMWQYFMENPLPFRGSVKFKPKKANCPPNAPWKFNPDRDLDWRGKGKSHNDAIDEAFRRTGVPREDFEVTKWGKDAHGKSHPVEWRAKGGAEVNVDWPHAKNGPALPHVGYQTPGKGNAAGHIILDSVPYNR